MKEKRNEKYRKKEIKMKEKRNEKNVERKKSK